MGQRGRRAATLAGVVSGALLLGSPAALADKSFHTTTFPLRSVDSRVTGSVVDIHAQGPRIFAQERYRLRGASPGTAYVVALYGCDGGAPFAETTMTANRAGNAHGKQTYRPMGLPAGTYSLLWTVTVAGSSQVVARTECVPVDIDLAPKAG